MYVNTINNVTKRHMPAEREEQKVAAFDSAVMLKYLNCTEVPKVAECTSVHDCLIAQGKAIVLIFVIIPDTAFG